MSDKDAPNIIKSQRYIIDGKEYRSLSEIPESEKKRLGARLKLLEDKDNDGIPDILQKKSAHTSYVETKVVRVSSAENMDKAGDLLKNVLRDLGADSVDTQKQGEEPKTQEVESPLRRRQREEQRTEKTRYYIVILALVAVIVFLLLK
jgi:hypothetical protein